MDLHDYLTTERKAVLAQLREIANTVEREKRSFTPEEARRVASLRQQCDELKAKLAAIVPEKRYPEINPLGNQARRRRSTGRGKLSADLWGTQLSDGGWPSFEAFLCAVHSNLHHPNLRSEALTMTGGVPSAGGFAVPEQFAVEMLDKSLEDEIVRPRAEVRAMDSDTLKVAGFNSLNHSSTLFGGLSAVWMAENDTAVDDDASLRLIELKAKKLAIFSRVSNELVADGLGFEQMLGEALVGAIAWHMDYAFLRGTGAGQPLGVLNNSSLVTVAKESGQPAATIVHANLVKMFARLHPACVSNSVWVVNQTAIPQLLQLTVAVGTGGAHIPVLSETDGQFTLLTRPVVFTEKLPTLGTLGDILLADFSQYVIGLRKEMSLEKSMHVGWQTDTSGYRCIVRADGQGKWSEAMTPRAGDTLSWAVALATRA